MPKIDTQELRKQKAERIQKTIRLERPDRAPFCFLLGVSAFQAEYVGYSVAEISHDYSKFFSAMIKFSQDFDHDWGFAFPGLANQVTLTLVEDHPEIAPSVGLITAPMHDILQDNYTKWPGRELGDNIAPQFIGGKFLEIEEYDRLIENPKTCINEVVLPRAYRSLAKPDSAEAYGALIKLGMEAGRFGAAMGAASAELSSIGYPQAPVGTCNDPYDLIADFIRHFDNTIMDFHRVPDKLKQAAEAILPYSLKIVEVSTAVPPELKYMYDFQNSFVFYPLHLNEFLSPKLYNNYYWLLLKKQIEADIAAGRIPLIFFEGDHTPHLETLLEIPKGKIIAYFERPDWNKVAEVLKGHQCVMGGLPPSLLISKGAIYHVIARGNNRQEIFIKQSDGEKYLSLLREYKDKFSFKLYVYVLMSNHVHLLVKVSDYTLSQIMQGIQQSYAKYFNKKYQRVGHVFQGRYMSKICVNDAYLFSLLRYIHQNPVRAGVTETPNYRWSSHDSYLNGFSDFVDVDFILSLISANKQQAIEQFAHLMQVPVEKGDVEPAFSSYKDEELQKPEPEEIPGLSMETLLEVVASETGIDAEQLMSATRARKVVAARNLAIFLAVNNGAAKRSELAQLFNVSLPRVSRGYYTVLGNEELRTSADRIMDLLKAIKQPGWSGCRKSEVGKKIKKQ